MLNKSIKQSEPEYVKRVGEFFKTSYTYISPVYIKRAATEPDIQHTIKVFKYRKVVHDMIENMREANPDLGIEGVEPFNLVKGKDFYVKVTKGEKGRNWESCRFLDEASNFEFKFNDKTFKIDDVTEKHEQAYQKFFDSIAPDIEQYHHKPWDEETTDQVITNIVDIIDYNTVLNKLIDQIKDNDFKNKLKDKMSDKVSATHTITEDVQTPFEPPQQSQPEPKNESHTTSEPSDNAKTEDQKETDDLDKLLDENPEGNNSGNEDSNSDYDDIDELIK
jgi:hypothetical protein